MAHGLHPRNSLAHAATARLHPVCARQVRCFAAESNRFGGAGMAIGRTCLARSAPSAQKGADMHTTLRHLFRHSWFRIAAALWVAVLCGGVVAVQRRALIAGMADGAGLANLSDGGARTVFAIAAALCGFVAAYAVLTFARPRESKRRKTGVAATRREAEMAHEDRPVEEIADSPPASEQADAEHVDIVEPIADREEDEALPPPALSGISALRQAWLDQTGEILAPASGADGEIAFERDEAPEPAEPLPETANDPAETVSEPPTLTELGDRLAQAIVRLERSTKERGTYPPAPALEEGSETGEDDRPLLDAEARRAVEQALARLEGFAARS